MEIHYLSILVGAWEGRVGVIWPPEIWSWGQWRRNEFESGGGAPIRRKAPEKKFLVVPLHFLALKAQLVVLVSAFVMVSTVWSVT